MDSYVELTFIHNLLVHSISLTCACIYSRKIISHYKFICIILLTTLLPSFLFIENSTTFIWINEILLFLFQFKFLSSTYLCYVGCRFIFHIIFYLLFDGTIYHLQFFIFDEKVLIFDIFVFIFYLSILLKIKYSMSEKEFIYPFILNHQNYLGYMDSGNFATYEHIPIIFIKEFIYHSLIHPAQEIFIETIQNTSCIEIKKIEIIINHKKQVVYCSPYDNDNTYDALLNMKGIL